MKDLVIGIDIGATKIAAGLLDRQENHLRRGFSRSVTKLPTIQMLAQLLDLRLSRATLDTDAGLWRLVRLLRGFQSLKGWHVQFNVVDSKTLLADQKNPEEYKDLVVRVAGYSALFVTLDKATEDDIIQRTVHEL